ncbi:MAG: lysylphosphatidylglycerol synthase transmembrane domain-containing protein [Acidimicrobiia bacterium]|nr:lysylphosphatidylglycerol synthase transmembrane domain-containing protein [Acidimicrobiia bacterium]
MKEEAHDVQGKRTAGRDVLIRTAGLVLVAIVLWLLFTRLVSWSEVADAISGLDSGDWALLIAVSLARVAVEPLLLMASTPKLSWSRALPGFLAPAAAASVVPGPSDLAARYAMFRSWGYSAAETSASVILVFLYSTFAKIALPVVAAAMFLFFGRANAELETVAIVAGSVLIAGILLIFLLIRSETTARRLGRAAAIAARRVASWFRIKTPEDLAANLADRAAHFRDRTQDVVRSRTHLAGAAAMLAQVGLFTILLASVRVVGVTADQLDWVSVFAAFAFVQLITSVPITPSGLGVAEAAYVTLLTAESNADLAGPIAAAALIYRLFSWVLLVPLGGLSWLWWTRSRHNVARNTGEGT